MNKLHIKNINEIFVQNRAIGSLITLYINFKSHFKKIRPSGAGCCVIQSHASCNTYFISGCTLCGYSTVEHCVPTRFFRYGFLFRIFLSVRGYTVWITIYLTIATTDCCSTGKNVHILSSTTANPARATVSIRSMWRVRLSPTCMAETLRRYASPYSTVMRMTLRRHSATATSMAVNTAARA